ncbi:MAG: hypothetical protein E6J71_26055 [Deltaproteobacteria bacterium]|nr:MAG: hypothetical protein E6J71_26055 [Deltaproteobacteria bacterium]
MRTVRLLGRALGAAALALALAACGGHRAPASSAVMLPALQPPAPPEPGPTYRIQLGDELHVRFTFQPEMNEQVPGCGPTAASRSSRRARSTPWGIRLPSSSA